jgi:hypothetical protein
LAAAGEAMHQAPSEAVKLPKLAKVPGVRSYDVAYRDIAIASDLPFATTDTVLGDAAVGKLPVAGGRMVQVWDVPWASSNTSSRFPLGIHRGGEADRASGRRFIPALSFIDTLNLAPLAA